MNDKAAKCSGLSWLALLGLVALFGPAVEVASAQGGPVHYTNQSVTLSWNLSANPYITNYNVYVGVESGVFTTEIAVGVTNMATLNDLVVGANYFFAVTAVDAMGMESPYSNETNYAVPFPTTPPAIASQPSNQTVLSGSPATFTVSANGAPPLFYQWSFNGTSISGATNQWLTLPDVLPAEAGNYAVLVTNSYGSILSSNAALILAETPWITTQPASQSVELDCSATLNVNASGTCPMSYQWFNNGVALPSQTNASLAMTGAQPPQFGQYSVVVNNPFGAVTSAVAVLALAVPPTTAPCTVERFAQGGLRMNVSALLANDTVATYDTLTVTAVSPRTTAGGTVTLRNPWIYYAPPAGSTAVDSFTYSVSDGHCGSAIGSVTVEPNATNAQPLHFAIADNGDGSFQLSFDGLPGGTYQLQSVTNLFLPNWEAMTNQVADEFGVFQYTDRPATNTQAQFYRAVSQASSNIPVSPSVSTNAVAYTP